MKKLLTGTAIAVSLLFAPAAWSQISVSVNIAPPPLPEYAQPMAPGDGYIWTPGYWAWSPGDGAYYWVPGTWVLAPEAGDLWTPGYWAYEGSGYFWHTGYWGPQVGFYGGLNYGYGYFGSGYQGGRWDRGVFRYNRAVSNVNTRVVHNVYNTRVTVSNQSNHVSFNGGRGGRQARPTADQRRFQAAAHPGPSADQMQHERAAMSTPTQRANGPHGVPQVAATPKPSGFGEQGAEHMRPGAAPRAQRQEHQERPEPSRPQAAQAPRPQAAPPQRPERAEPVQQAHPQPVPTPRPQATPPQRPQPAQQPRPEQRQEQRPEQRPQAPPQQQHQQAPQQRPQAAPQREQREEHGAPERKEGKEEPRREH